MNRTLILEQILIYYDIPQLFIAKDMVDTKVLCLLVDEHEYKYIGLPISQTKLNNLMLGKLDLREAFQSSEIGYWLEVLYDAEIIASSLDIKQLPENYLPEAGFYFPPVEASDELLIKDVNEKRTTIIHLAFSDVYNSNSLEIDVLADLMKIFQGFVKYSFKKSIADLDKQIKKRLDKTSNYSLKTFATSPGSFNIRLESNSDKDMFGSTEIERALINIYTLLDDSITEEEQIIKLLRTVKGHALSNYKKLLEKIIQENLKLTYKWVSPSSNDVNKRIITKPYAEKIYEILSSKTELEEEIVEFSGYVEQADVASGSWRIHNLEDHKEYTGKAKGGVNLSGIILHEKQYKFICEEISEELRVMEKEKIQYWLISIEDTKITP